MKGCDICSKKCFGIEGYDGSCCSVEERDWIIGPHHDVEEFLIRLEKKFQRKIEFKDIFYEYEEGKEVFKDRESWQNPNTYPALRIDLEKKKKPCIFYNTEIKACSIYEIRPSTCINFKCQFLKNNETL